MDKIYADYFFLMSDGSTKKLTLQDLKENADGNAVLNFADLLISKNSVIKQTPIVSLVKCIKYVVQEEILK